MAADRTAEFGRSWLLVGLALGIATAAGAQETDLPGLNGRGPLAQSGFSLNAAVLRSDNVRRAADSQVGGELATVGTTMDLLRTGTRLDYDLIGDLQWTDYFNNAYPRKLLGYFDGTVLLGIVPQTFVWDMHESLDQFNSDPFTAPTPDHISTVNYFSTGPRVSLHLGPLTALTLDGNYAKVNTISAATEGVGNLNLDSRRYSGGATLQRALSNSTFVSLAGTSERVNFDRRTSGPDYDINTVSLGYAAATVRMRVRATAGYNQLHVQGRTLGGATGRLEITRRISPTSTVALTVAQEISDALDLIRSDIRAPTGQPLTYRLSQPEPIRDRTVDVAWTHELGLDSMVLNVAWTREQSDLDPRFNRIVKGGAIRYSRRLRPTLTLETRGAFVQEQYNQVGFRDQEFDARVGFVYQPALRYGLTVRYEFFDRTSTPASARFRETRIGLAFVYHVL